MKRATGTILAWAATAAVAWSAIAAAPSPAPKPSSSPKPAVSSNGNAPADESFGPFKYTAISVRTKIDLLGRSYRERWADDASLVHDAGLVESSYNVWAQRYPRDKWLPPTAFHLAQLYAEIQTPMAKSKALSLFKYVAASFPGSKEAHLAKLRLQQGITAHDETAVAPTPSPYGPNPTASAAEAAAALPSPTAAATETPTATPAPTPTPTPTPKKRTFFPSAPG
ncbi:MAG TPA: hypothetical protein VGN14_03470 [Candidatus Elarobacter sp.]